MVGIFACVAVSADSASAPNSLNLLSSETVPEHMKIGFSVALAFLAIFFTYGFGVVLIKFGERFRAALFGGMKIDDVVLVARSGNTVLEKLLEQNSNTSKLLDGLGLGLFGFFVFSSVAMTFANPWWVAAIGFLAGASSAWLFWRESAKAISSFSLLVERFHST